MNKKKSSGFTVGGIENFYDQNVQQGLELFSAYIEQCEISSNVAIDDFYKYKSSDVFDSESEHPYLKTSFRDIDGHTFDPEYIYRDVFPQMVRHSILLMLMSFIENELLILCKKLARNKLTNTNFSRRNYPKTKSLLTHIKCYLVEEAHFSFDDELNIVWNDVFALQAIRNNIIHNSGKYKRSKQPVDAFIDNNPHISIENQEIIIDSIFLGEVISLFKDLFMNLQANIRTQKN